jgi:hypothetical protein
MSKTHLGVNGISNIPVGAQALSTGRRLMISVVKQ